MTANQLEITNNDYQTALFEGREGHTMKEYCLRTFKELLIKLTATVISDLACVYFFYTALETSLSDFLSLKWEDYHKFSLGDLLIMQYEKAQSIPKFIYEFFISLTSCIFQITALIISITHKTNKSVGSALTASGFAHIVMFFFFFKTYNKLQSNYLHSKSKSRAIVNEEANSFNVIKSYNLENVSITKVDGGQENRRAAKMRYAAYDAKSGLVYKFFEIFSLSVIYIFYYMDKFSGNELNVVTKQIVLLYEAMRHLLKALGDLRNEFHVFYKLEEHLSSNMKNYDSTGNNKLVEDISTELKEKSLEVKQRSIKANNSSNECSSPFINGLGIDSSDFSSSTGNENIQQDTPLILKDGKISNFLSLNCEDLSFNNVFSQVSFSIKVNEKIAIVGRNGSGKTSLLRMLVGLYDSKGKISINTIKLENINPKVLRNLVTFVSQDDAYTLGSVMKNLQYGNNLSREEVIAKCKLFNVDSTFECLKNGYDTVSNSLGTEFSGGQKQKISFMRGVLRDTPVLVIDDCLNGVTTVDKLFLTQKILSLNDRTIIMTCDRFENLKFFDKILILNSENNKYGRFEELETDLRTHFGKSEI